MSDWIMKLSIVERYGSRIYYRAIDIPITIFGERMVSEMSCGLGLVSFNEAVTILKERKLRRDELDHLARQLAQQLVDYLEDKEGWHGEARQEAAKRSVP